LLPFADLAKPPTRGCVHNSGKTLVSFGDRRPVPWDCRNPGVGVRARFESRAWNRMPLAPLSKASAEWSPQFSRPNSPSAAGHGHTHGMIDACFVSVNDPDGRDVTIGIASKTESNYRHCSRRDGIVNGIMAMPIGQSSPV